VPVPSNSQTVPYITCLSKAYVLTLRCHRTYGTYHSSMTASAPFSLDPFAYSNRCTEGTSWCPQPWDAELTLSVCDPIAIRRQFVVIDSPMYYDVARRRLFTLCRRVDDLLLCTVTPSQLSHVDDNEIISSLLTPIFGLSIANSRTSLVLEDWNDESNSECWRVTCIWVREWV
jgi:hypothetical protein